MLEGDKVEELEEQESINGTKREVVLNRLSVRPGDLIDIRKIRNSERRLGSSAIFADEAAGTRVLSERRLEQLQQAAKSLYRRLSPTKEWMENNYYQLQPQQQTIDLVRMNRFWRDYANHDGGTFLSPYFSEANRTFTEMMFALSVLDLPMKEPKQKFEYADNSMTMTATWTDDRSAPTGSGRNF